MGWLSIASGYRLQLEEPTALYAEWENAPLNQQRELRTLHFGETVNVVRCVDIKSDVYFEVETLDGQRGVMYSMRFVATKDPFWTHPSNWHSALLHPIDALTCVSLLPRFSATR